MRRRDFMKLAGTAVLSAALPGCAGSGVFRRSSAARPATYYVPGQARSKVYFEGSSVREHPQLARGVPKRLASGKLTLLTRVDESDGSVRRAVLPLNGHSVAVHPDGGIALCNTQNGATMVSFDPVTLDVGALLEFEGTIRGGGHSVFLPDGKHSIVTEREEYRQYTGNEKYHRGRIAVRENESLAIVESYDCHGIAPHDIELLVGDQYVAVANYGSTSWPAGSVGFQNYMIEPCVAVIEVSSGKLVHRYKPSRPSSEFRHLAAHDLSRIFVLQNNLVSLTAYNELMRDSSDVYQPVLQKFPATSDASLPVLHVDFDGDERVAQLSHEDPKRMLRGQSITYDPVHNEVLATFPVSQSVIAFSAGDGSVRGAVRTDRLGLKTPRGIALHPDGEHYVVTGNEENLFVFERGSHRLVRSRCIYERFFGHPHVTAA